MPYAPCPIAVAKWKAKFEQINRDTRDDEDPILADTITYNKPVAAPAKHEKMVARRREMRVQ